MGGRARSVDCVRPRGADRGRIALLALVLALGACASAARADAPSSRPFFEEDWSDVESREVAVPPFKHMDLDPGGEIWAGLGGELRSRAEAWRHYRLGEHDDTLGGARMRVYADFHFMDRMRLYSEVLSAFSAGRELPGGDDAQTEELALQNAFLELRFAASPRRGLRLRAGRQELALGSERLVGTADFRNAGRRTFDGASLAWQERSMELLGFVFFPVDTSAGDWNDVQTDPFLGLWFTRRDLIPGMLVDVYALGVDRDRGVPVGDPVRFSYEVNDSRYTLGGRVRMERGPAAFELEAGYQGGRQSHGRVPPDQPAPGEGAISAWFASAELEDRLPALALEPRVWIGLDVASGGDSPLDPGTFDPLFSSEHPFLGDADLVGRANVADLHVGLEVDRPLGDPRAGRSSARDWGTLGFAVEVHGFWRPSDDDALYAPSGAIVRLPFEDSSLRPVDDRFVGVETDLRLRWSLERFWTVELGYAHLFPGSFVRSSGPGLDLDFAYAELTFSF